jgi:hypothetical protein
MLIAIGKALPRPPSASSILESLKVRRSSEGIESLPVLPTNNAICD